MLPWLVGSIGIIASHGIRDMLIIWSVTIAACALLGLFVSGQKQRPPMEGLILGVLFGPFGVLIAALLPTGGGRAAKAKAHSRIGAPLKPVGPPPPTGWAKVMNNLFGAPPHQAAKSDDLS